MPGFRPTRADALAELIAGHVASLSADRPVRLAVDGPPVARPDRLADALVAPMRRHGRPVLRVRAADFLRPASLRLERGRTDPDALYDDALDVGGLLREVLVPLGPGGTGRYLPTLWDAERDRATRAAYVEAPPGAVLVLDGAFLLRPPLRTALDVAVHLHVSAGALRRRTPASEAWTLPAYDRYDAEAAPVDAADVVVRYDDPAHPAVRFRDEVRTGGGAR